MKTRSRPHSIIRRSPVTKVFHRLHRPARALRPDRQIAEMEPELVRSAAERDRNGDRVVVGDRFLHEPGHLGVVDHDKLQIGGLLQRRVWSFTKNHRSNMPPESAFTYGLINRRPAIFGISSGSLHHSNAAVQKTQKMIADMRRDTAVLQLVEDMPICLS